MKRTVQKAVTPGETDPSKTTRWRMKKRRFISKDSDFFKDQEESIKLEHCPDGGQKCKVQMATMNEHLLLTRKLIENKEFSRGTEVIKKAFDTTFDLKDKQCQGCAELFRSFITQTVHTCINELEELTTGFLANKRYKSDLENARTLLLELKKQQTLL